MRDEILPTLSELLRLSKEKWNEDHSSEAECFVDAFSNGEYHEEDFSWGDIASCLNANQLVSLFLPVCHALIRGATEHREGESLDAIMKLYSNLVKWQKHHLKDPMEILQSLDDVRPYVLKLSSESGWIEGKYFFQMLDCGIRRRMGLTTHQLDSAYNE